MFGLRGAVTRFFAADGFFLGAGLAFFFLLSMIPLTLLAAAAVGFVLSSERAGQEVVGQLTRNFPVYRREIAIALLAIVENRRVSGVLGTIILVFVSTPLLSACRLVMHRLLAVRNPQGFLKNLAVDSAAVVLLSVLLFGATVVTWLLEWFQAFVLEPANVSTEWIERTSIALSAALSAAMFFLGYRYLPRRRVVGVGPALAGSVVATALWEIAKRLFRLYIRKVGLYGQIYGPLGVLVAFVMFVYYSAIVFVFGAAYVAELASRRRAR